MPTTLYNSLAEYSDRHYKSVGASVREAVALLCAREGYSERTGLATQAHVPAHVTTPAGAAAPTKPATRRQIAAKPKD
jgi:hypothetical protein